MESTVLDTTISVPSIYGVSKEIDVCGGAVAENTMLFHMVTLTSPTL